MTVLIRGVRGQKSTQSLTALRTMILGYVHKYKVTTYLPHSMQPIHV